MAGWVGFRSMQTSVEQGCQLLRRQGTPTKAWERTSTQKWSMSPNGQLCWVGTHEPQAIQGTGWGWWQKAGHAPCLPHVGLSWGGPAPALWKHLDRPARA